MRKNTSLRAVFVLSVAVAALVLAANAASAAMIFSEDFENPVVAGYAQGQWPADWVGANQGYNSNKHGLDNKASGDFTAPVGNDQAYAFRYTNSGLTTAAGVIGSLTSGTTYTVSFDVVMDGGGNNGTPYTVQLIAFADGAPRNDCRSTPSGSTLLTAASGKANNDGTWKTVSFQFTPDPDVNAGDLGKDLGIRLIGASTSATIDNVQVDAVPEPATMALLALGGLGLLKRRRRAS